MTMTSLAATLAVGLTLTAVGLSVLVTVGHHVALWAESRRWRSRYRVAAVESRRWRRDGGHPGGHAVYARVRDRRQGRRHA